MNDWIGKKKFQFRQNNNVRKFGSFLFVNIKKVLKKSKKCLNEPAQIFDPKNLFYAKKWLENILVTYYLITWRL